MRLTKGERHLDGDVGDFSAGVGEGGGGILNGEDYSSGEVDEQSEADAGLDPDENNVEKDEDGEEEGAEPEVKVEALEDDGSVRHWA